jgi:hypothetical protein
VRGLARFRPLPYFLTVCEYKSIPLRVLNLATVKGLARFRSVPFFLTVCEYKSIPLRLEFGDSEGISSLSLADPFLPDCLRIQKYSAPRNISCFMCSLMKAKLSTLPHKTRKV